MEPVESKTEIEVLTHEIKRLNRSFSLHAALIRGIVTGFGSAIGAGLLVALVAVVFEQLTGLPILGQLFAFLAGSLPYIK